MARTVMSFQNQLAQNRRVLAGQMEQVGELFAGLAGDIDAMPVKSRRRWKMSSKENWEIFGSE